MQSYINKFYNIKMALWNRQVNISYDAKIKIDKRYYADCIRWWTT